MKEYSFAILFSSHNVCIQNLPMLFEKRWKPSETLRRGARVQPWFSSVGFNTKVEEITCGAVFLPADSGFQWPVQLTPIHFPKHSTTDGTFFRQISGTRFNSRGPGGCQIYKPDGSSLPSSPFPFSEGWKAKRSGTIQWFRNPIRNNHLDVFFKALVNKKIFAISTSDRPISELPG